MTYWTPCDEDGVDGGCGRPAVGSDAPSYVSPGEPVSDIMRRVQCRGCDEIVELPARMVRGSKTCGCGRLRVVATSLSSHQYSAHDGVGVYGRTA